MLNRREQWTSALLDAGVFVNQSTLAAALGCHRGTVSRGVLTAKALLGERWIERLVRLVMHEFTGRSANRLADACADAARREAAKRRARNLQPGVSASSLYKRLFGDGAEPAGRETVFVRRKGRAGGGVVAAKIERDGEGGFTVSVARPRADAGRAGGTGRTDRGAGGCGDRRGGGHPPRAAFGRIIDCAAGEGRSPLLARRLHLGGCPRQRPGMGPVALRGGRRRAASAGGRLGVGNGSRYRFRESGCRRHVADVGDRQGRRQRVDQSANGEAFRSSMAGLGCRRVGLRVQVASVDR